MMKPTNKTRRLGRKGLAIVATGFLLFCFVNLGRSVTLSTPTVASGSVSFSFDSAPGQLLTVQSSGLGTFVWADVSYYVGTGGRIQFSVPLGAAPLCFRVRVTEFRALDLAPNGPLLATGSVSLPDAVSGAAYSEQIGAALTGLPPYALSVSGTPPDGVSLVVVSNGTADASIRVSAGGPGLVAGQRRQFAVSAVDSLNSTNTRNFDLRVVTPPPEFASQLLVLKAGEPFAGSLQVTNGTSPLGCTNLSGPMPSGVVLAVGGSVSGTPSADDAERLETGRFTNLIVVADSYTDRVTGALVPRRVTNTVVQLVRLSYAQNIWSERPNGPSLSGICIFCHGPGFTPDVGSPDASLIIGATSQQFSACPDRVYVTPGNLSASLIFNKLAGPDCGARMPYGGPYFDATRLARMERWIRELRPGDRD